ncbi:sugar ABC transporter permease YjfF [Thioclava sp. BHET1]|uniref:ABC transporter permease n=1 Tax=Thioclava dalianensis TaxID=1185766 RepID=A0A074TNI3_9RHOB|nr:galactofuranose ABC transporter, permease protein YjfF [Thioclava dalianensis]KEP70568.1 ABC transporter permease [Thioclava dalianensis]TMV90634.1 sugar ABC transporter permease YjfF [Thioclava sp. BHET1]SFN07466.1 simple sugar transport system permease protein [Thioclava dalianensis]
MRHSTRLPLYITIVTFFVAYAACIFQFPNMLSSRVVANLLTDNAFLGITAVGMTFVILSGGIDLSVGSVIAFTGVFLAVILRDTSIHPLAAFAIVLVITTVFGAAMGAIIYYLEMPPFIVTLAGMFLMRGLAYVLSTESVPITHEFYGWLQSLYWKAPGGGRFRITGLLMVLSFVAAAIALHRTRFGRNVYALGGSAQTAQLMGVPCARTTISIYAVSGGLAGLAGIVYSLYTSAGYSLATVGTELDAIAAVVIGGTLLSGGSGFVAGTFFGIMIMGLIQTYIVFDGTLSSWWTKIVIGGLLFTFIMLQKGLAWATTARIPRANVSAARS